MGLLFVLIGKIPLIDLRSLFLYTRSNFVCFANKLGLFANIYYFSQINAN